VAHGGVNECRCEAVIQAYGLDSLKRRHLTVENIEDRTSIPPLRLYLQTNASTFGTETRAPCVSDKPFFSREPRDVSEKNLKNRHICYH
jgi:hypothetical protein